MGTAIHRIGDAPPPSAGPCVLVVGNFDGIHRGHATVLRQAVAAATAAGVPARVLTFDPHPAAVVGAGAPPLLTTLERRAELVAALGVERVWVRRFDRAFAAWSPDRFVRELVAGPLAAQLVVVGENFRYGANRAGDLASLRAMGTSLGFGVLVHDIASDAHGPYSSTRARESIAAGDLGEAAGVLGRPHSLSGVVVEGDRRGRALGFPTANLGDVAEILPPDGVYAVRVSRLDAALPAEAPGVTNIGFRPTVSGTRRSIETHLLGFAGDLYGAPLRLALVARIRAERRFDGLDALKAQIAVDCEAARSLL